MFYGRLKEISLRRLYIIVLTFYMNRLLQRVTIGALISVKFCNDACDLCRMYLIVGSLGHVHKRFRSGLRKVGIPGYETKFLANYCSISAIIGSHKVWKMRCRAMNI